MRILDYPWSWLNDAVQPAFTVRFPWIDAVRRACDHAEAVCLLIPECAGSSRDWGDWLEARLDSCSPINARGQTFRSVAVSLEQYSRVDPMNSSRPGDWVQAFLPEARRYAPHVEPLPLLVTEPDADCVAGLKELLSAQQAINYPLVRPVIVTHRLPTGWTGDVLRVGLPEPVGDLHRLRPHVNRDPDFWTNAMLALTVLWEVGAVPTLAEELWEELSGTRNSTLRDAGFDEWLSGRLETFARKTKWLTRFDLPTALAFGPVRSDTKTEGLWHAGVLGFADGWFDLTPLRARSWLWTQTDESVVEAIKRRRLVNAPLARWLAAWAASIEEALRVQVLKHGTSAFRTFLHLLPPRDRHGNFANRWEELDPDGEESLVGSVEFGDLAQFICDRLERSRRARAENILNRCRQARNQVVHQRTATASDLLDIATTVEWLAEDGLI